MRRALCNVPFVVIVLWGELIVFFFARGCEVEWAIMDCQHARNFDLSCAMVNATL